MTTKEECPYKKSDLIIYKENIYEIINVCEFDERSPYDKGLFIVINDNNKSTMPYYYLKDKIRKATQKEIDNYLTTFTMKYYIQIKPKDKPVGLYLLSSIGNNHQYSTTEHLKEAMSFQSRRYNGLDPEHFAFLLFDLIGFESNFNDNDELVSDFIIRLISEEEIAQIQELATWKSTFVELPRNGECIAFRFSETFNTIRKGYMIRDYDFIKTFEIVEVSGIGNPEMIPLTKRLSKSIEVFWKPLVY